MASKSGLTDTINSTKQAVNTAQTQGGANLGAASTGYQNFAATGGITPQMVNQQNQQVASGIGSLEDTAQRGLNQQKMIQGGYSPGYGANQSQITRNTQAQAGQAINQSNLGLTQLQTQNQLQGLGGLTNIGGIYQGQVPSLLGIQGQAAANRPGLAQEIGQWGNIIGNAGDAIATGIGGF